MHGSRSIPASMEDPTRADPPLSATVSVVVPVSERPEPLDGVYLEFSAPLRTAGVEFEFLFVLEPWARALAAPLQPLVAAGEPIRVLEVGQTVGETTLLKAGAAHARGAIVLTLPAYRRVEAHALPGLIARVEQGADVVVARRWPRRDSWFNRIQNRLFHSLISQLTGNDIHDVACGVRAVRTPVLRDLPLYGDFARFLPLFALREGYRVEEQPAPQHPGDARTRVFSPGIYLRRLVDVLGLFFLLRFTDKPLRFFGVLGSILATAGGALLLVLLAQRLGGQGIADRPLLLLSVLMLVLGVQAIALGLVGEIVVHLNAPARRPYRLAHTVEINSTRYAEPATDPALPLHPPLPAAAAPARTPAILSDAPPAAHG